MNSMYSQSQVANNNNSSVNNMSSLDRVTDSFHVSEHDVSVAALQLLHERQIVADFETLDWILLQEKLKNCWSWSFHFTILF